jgi:hypothetical protein
VEFGRGLPWLRPPVRWSPPSWLCGLVLSRVCCVRRHELCVLVCTCACDVFFCSGASVPLFLMLIQ